MLKRLIAVLAALLTLAFLAGCGSEDSGGDATAKDTSKSEPSDAPAAGECEYTEDGTPAAKKVELPPAVPTDKGEVPLTITTSAGAIKATLDASKTPCTVNSFVSLAKQNYFNDTECHRLTTEGIFVLQCGDPTGSGSGGPGYSFADELAGTETYGPGTLAMANSGPDTNGSQFFIVYGDSGLDPAYTVFGTIDAAGLKVVEKIGKAGTADGAPDGAPKTPVKITSVK